MSACNFPACAMGGGCVGCPNEVDEMSKDEEAVEQRIEKAVVVDWNKWNEQCRKELENWPFCHFTPMEYIEDSDSDGHLCESSSGYSCHHCSHTKPLDWRVKK